MGLVGGAVVVAVWQWWLEAQSRWVARLAARGLLKGRYSAWDAATRRWFGSPGWVFKQRVTAGDALAIRRLAGLPDGDSETEVWRVRSAQRRRIAVVVTLSGVVWLVIAAVLANAL